MTRRLFVAAWLPETIAQEVARVRERLKDSGADVKWVPTANLHVTLRFLGDVDSDRVDELGSLLKTAVRPVPRFSVQWGGFGQFPSRGRPRVIWLGATVGARELTGLATRVEAALVSAQWQEALDETPFRPHVTLGRPKGAGGLGRLESLLEEMAFVGERHSLEEVTLAESRRSPRGATYTAVARFPLEGA